MFDLLWLLLPVAAASGWFVAKREYKRNAEESSYELPQDYFKGLNYILNEQPDKAIDIFQKLSEVDEGMVEIHLALGSLFRRRGEVDRAIRLHQGLLNQPSLATDLYPQVVLELALDYMRAGLLDRAEVLCLELVDVDDRNQAALKLLCDIYQQEKEWFRAIDVMRKLAVATGESQSVPIAHFYCELALEFKLKNDLVQARRTLNKALDEDKASGRALIVLGEIEREEGNYDAAISTYQRLESDASEYLSEVLADLQVCYLALGQDKELIAYLKRVINQHHAIEVVLIATRLLKENESEEAALEFLGKEVTDRPSLRGIQYLLELDMNKLGRETGHLSVIKDSLDKLLANKPVYRCNCCGFTGKEMHWLCPSCKNWSTIHAIQEFQWGASI